MASPASPASPKSPKEEEVHMFEKIEDIRAKHAESLAAVRSKLSLPCEDDFTVYRFLRGHKLNVDVAASHLEATLQWRKTNGLDELRKKAEKINQKQYPFADKVLAVHPHNIIHGHDKSGQPLSIERLGYANPYLMTRTMKFEDMQAYHFYHMEAKASIVNNLSATRGVVIRTCKIMDLSGLGRHHLDRRGLVFFKKLIDMSQNNYPEMLGRLYVVNTPWIFSLGWKIVKPWLNPATLNKIVILQNSEIAAALRADIPAEHIPDFLGGECTCEGRGCVPLVDPDAAMTKVAVSARGKFEHRISIDADMLARLRSSAVAEEGEGEAGNNSQSSSAEFLGANVAYEFRTKKNDIAFEARAEGGSGGSKMLHELKRYESDSDIIAGSFVVSEPCTLVFLFDNSFSYFTGKTLLYRFDVDAAVKHSQDADEAGVEDALEHAEDAQGQTPKE